MHHEFIPYAIAFREPVVTASGLWTVRRGAWLRVEDAHGNVGFGEAAPLEPLDRPKALAAALESGPYREAAFEVAALDLQAQRFRRPLACLLTDVPRRQVAVNALLVSQAPAALADEAATAVAQGFGTVKIKVAVASTAEDIARVVAVRERVGPTVSIRLDANGGWDVESAIRALRGVEDCNIEYVEEPVAGDLRAVSRSTNVPVGADVASLEDGWRVIRQRSADVLVLKPMALGGLRPARELAVAAIEAGLGVVITSILESAVGVAGALHLAASLPGSERAHGLATVALLEEAPVEGLDPPRDGRMQLPAGPGLGVRLRQRFP